MYCGLGIGKLPEDADKHCKRNDICTRDPKVDNTHQNQENRTDNDRDDTCLADGSGDAAHQHAHGINRLPFL